MVFQKRIFLTCLTAAAFLPGGAFANVNFTQRTSTFDIDTGTSSFAGANTLYSIYSVVSADNVGDTYAGTLTIKPGFTNFNYYSTGGLSLAITPSTGASSWSFPTSNLQGTDTISYNNGATGFGTSYLQTGVSNGLNTLEFQGGGFGLLDKGGTFYLDVNLNGDWVNQGTSSGDIQILGYNSDFSAPKLTYNGTSTNIYMVDNNFSGSTTDGPGLDFKLYGSTAPTPSPESWMTFMTALLGLGLFSRRKVRSSKSSA